MNHSSLPATKKREKILVRTTIRRENANPSKNLPSEPQLLTSPPLLRESERNAF